MEWDGKDRSFAHQLGILLPALILALPLPLPLTLTLNFVLALTLTPFPPFPFKVISSKITSPASAVRHQAASVLAALALSAPAMMAKLLGSYLEAVEAGAQTLQMLAAPYSKPGVVGSSKLGPGRWFNQLVGWVGV